MDKNNFIVCERHHGLSKHDNDISYNIASIKIVLNTSNNTILVHNTASIKINMEPLISILKEVWEFNDSDIKKISSEEFIIKYDINIINNYLSYIITYVPNT